MSFGDGPNHSDCVLQAPISGSVLGPQPVPNKTKEYSISQVNSSNNQVYYNKTCLQVLPASQRRYPFNPFPEQHIRSNDNTTYHPPPRVPSNTLTDSFNMKSKSKLGEIFGGKTNIMKLYFRLQFSSII